MRITAGNPVLQAVSFTVVILLQDLLQITAVCLHGAVNHQRQLAVFPVRPDITDSKPGESAADQGIDDAVDGDIKPFTQQVKTEQHQQGNKNSGLGVLTGAEHKEHQPGQHHQNKLSLIRRHKIHDRQADKDPGECPHYTQHQAAPCGTVVRLADKQAGQHNPVTAGQIKGQDNGVTGTQQQRHPDSMAEQRGARCQVLPDTRPDITQSLQVFVGQPRIFLHLFRRKLSLLCGQSFKLGIDTAQVGQQMAQSHDTAVAGLLLLQQVEGVFQIRKCPLKTRVMVIFAALQNGLRNSGAGVSLHGHQPLKAEHNIAVTQFIA